MEETITPRPGPGIELTGGGDAVEAHESVEAGGCTRQNPRQSKGSESAHAELLLSSVRDKFKPI